ncbi:hypothetical protein [Pontimicrobium sp. MEBiC06410]|jgi:uncharacterized membrane protein YedE/YeeE
MKVILKKILGVLFILIGGFLSLSLLIQAPNTVINSLERKEVSGYGMAYVFGIIIGFLIFLIPIYFLFKFGFKWVSNKKKSRIEDVGSIGEN